MMDPIVKLKKEPAVRFSISLPPKLLEELLQLFMTITIQRFKWS